MQPEETVRSPEFELVLACVRWPQGSADAALIRKLAQQPIHWPHLLRIVHHHQVVSLVSRNIEAAASDCVPSETLSSLRAGAVENARFCFHGISELARIYHRFRQEQIDLLIFKGTPLALQAFGDATLRGVGDIDLLVRQIDIDRADRILRAEGYLRSEPDVWHTPRRTRSYISHQKDFSYGNPKSGATVDLHWRLFRNPWLPTNTGLEHAGVAWIQLGPESIPTLPLERLFLYLCVHGALDGWLRLKWLADIGAFLRKSSSEQLRTIVRAAMEQGVLPEVSAAILLCQQKLGFEEIPGECLSPQAPSVARILRFANRLITSNNHCPERYLIPSTAWFLNELTLHSSAAYRLELVERTLFRPRVWSKVSLPDALFPLYAVISPFEWLLFRIQRLTGSLWNAARKGRSSTGTGRAVWPRFFRLGLSDVALLAEAAVMLTFFRAALRFFPVERFTTWMSLGGPPNEEQSLRLKDGAIATIRRVEWAVGAIVRHTPLTFVCFPQSLAAYFMLRRRHIASKFFYGVAREQQQLKAHTWIKVGDRTVVGGDVESQFTVLAIFP
ncbi:MAG TPA: lasso peptide biosynthesis B2 protein [Acidobacteriaceae bacterium]|jgi:hypothetical protein